MGAKLEQNNKKLTKKQPDLTLFFFSNKTVEGCVLFLLILDSSCEESIHLFSDQIKQYNVYLCFYLYVSPCCKSGLTMCGAEILVVPDIQCN